jgi:predicted DNA-binding transcriptional regulator AlpA
MTPTAEPETKPSARLADAAKPAPDALTAEDVAAKLQCSVRYVWRMNDAGLMPPSFKLGRLVRWRSEVIAAWIASGCSSWRKSR